MSLSQPIPHTSLKTTLLGWCAGQLVRLLGCTVRSKVSLNADFLAHYETKPVIFVFWHNRLLLLPKAYAKHLQHRPVSVLTSASKDGAILARVVACFGMGAVRGSSSRRGAVALVQMRNTLAQGISMAITPDGPRGPIYQCAPGPVKLAEISAMPLVPVTVEYSRAWRLRSWDRFAIPKPFSTARIHFHAPVNLPKGMDDAAQTHARHQIEKVLQPQEMG